MTPAAMVLTGLRELQWHSHALPAVRRLFITLILLDLTFITLYILRAVALKYGLAPFDVTLQSPLFAIDTEGGYPEDWQYAKEVAAAALLLFSALRTRQAMVYGAWAALFAFAALDDSLAFHERAGAYLEQILPSRTGNLQWHDLGEPLFAGATGVVLLAAIAYTSLRSAPHHAARGWLFVFPIIGLAACGIGFDLLHAVVRYSYPGSNLILTLLEDGGEMLFMSLGCALAFATFMRAAEPCAPHAVKPFRRGCLPCLHAFIVSGAVSTLPGFRGEVS